MTRRLEDLVRGGDGPGLSDFGDKVPPAAYDGFWLHQAKGVQLAYPWGEGVRFNDIDRNNLRGDMKESGTWPNCVKGGEESMKKIGLSEADWVAIGMLRQTANDQIRDKYKYWRAEMRLWTGDEASLQMAWLETGEAITLDYRDGKKRWGLSFFMKEDKCVRCEVFNGTWEFLSNVEVCRVVMDKFKESVAGDGEKVYSLELY